MLSTCHVRANATPKHWRRINVHRPSTILLARSVGVFRSTMNPSSTSNAGSSSRLATQSMSPRGSCRVWHSTPRCSKADFAIAHAVSSLGQQRRESVYVKLNSKMYCKNPFYAMRFYYTNLATKQDIFSTTYSRCTLTDMKLRSRLSTSSIVSHRPEKSRGAGNNPSLDLSTSSSLLMRDVGRLGVASLASGSSFAMLLLSPPSRRSVENIDANEYVG